MDNVTKEKPAKKPKQPVVKKDKVITLNYYQLELDNLTDKAENAELIRNAFKSPPQAFTSLVREEDDGRISLLNGQLSTHENGLIYGTLIHTQFRDLPLEGSTADENFTELALGDDKGLGYDVSFLYDPAVNIVMIESVKNGVGMGVFCAFFEKNLRLQSLIATVVINPGQLNKFRSYKWFTKIHYKVARLQNNDSMKNERNALGDMIKAADKAGTNEMEVILSAGRYKNATLVSQVASAVIESVLKYTSKDNKDVKKLLVTGKSKLNEYTDEIDLIKQRVTSQIKIELVKKNSLKGISEKYKALYSAYVEHKAGLHKAYKI